MTQMTKLRGAALAVAVSVAGCAPGQEQQQAGNVIGAVVGGVIGAQVGHGVGRTAATIAGSMIGGMVGGNIGRSMDDTDRLRTAQALESGPTGTPSQWRNPDTGAEYTVTPTRTFPTVQGPCREYTMDGLIGGRAEKVYGTACRQPDGSWRVVN